jgi:hypothetical protein
MLGADFKDIVHSAPHHEKAKAAENKYLERMKAVRS